MRDYMMEQIREMNDPFYEELSNYEPNKMKTHIAGIPHRKPNFSLLTIGDSVRLVPEPDNKFDPNAIRVLHGDTFLGYIPKMETAEWRSASSATIVEIQPNRKWSEVIIESAV